MVCVCVCVRGVGVKIRIRKEEGALEILAKVENKTSYLESCYRKLRRCQKYSADINTQAPNSNLTY